jgi:lipopolysaccharide export LptBFGC system permease protein LptF
MKRIITFCLLSMTVGILLTSCGTSYSITKRQHSKGYHVSSNKKYTAPAKIEKVEEFNETAANQSAEEAVFTKEINVTPTLVSDLAETISTNSVAEETKGSKNTATASIYSISDSHTENDKSSKLSERTIFTPLSILKTANTSLKSTVTAMQSRSSGEGLSLLWIVIIVLLILWALGYIGGVGSSGLIHLLLVIALILLILWLLRII